MLLQLNTICKMPEITKIFLENEMDLILAHKRSMKLAELTGLSLSGQTSFGTAVSEVCRFVINKQTAVTVLLGIGLSKDKNTITATVIHAKKDVVKTDEALTYAAKLADDVYIGKTKAGYTITLEQKTPGRQKFTIEQIDEWRGFFRNEKPFSPYEEVRLKNIQLKELTEKLIDSEGRYKALAESLPLGIFTSTEQGTLVYLNNWMKEFSGQDIEQINQSGWKSLIHQEDLELIKRKQREEGRYEILPSDKVAEYRLKNKDGSYVWHVGSSVPVQDENNKLKYWIGYLVDIHAQKLVEETLKDNKALKEAHELLARYQFELEDRIQELNRINFDLEQFAYVASHDLQEPLRKLLVYNDYIQRKFSAAVDEDTVYILDKMKAAAYRMRSLITDVLNFSKIRKNELVFAPTNLNLVTKNIIESLEQHIKEKNAVITMGNLPTLEASAIHITQLLENLLSNALKYTRQGVQPEIIVQGETNGNIITLHISDNGIGFEDKYAEKIFGLFQRLHNKEEFEGTGIGLAICKKIAELHNGSITGTGIPGQGSRFTISLPVMQAK